MKPLITAHAISKEYKKDSRGPHSVIFKDLSLTVHKGEFLMLLGPSGCGKSTLVRMLAGLETAYQGEITYSADFDKSRIGFVFQDFGIFPWLTVFENIELNLLNHKMSDAERAHKVNEYIRLFGLHDVAHMHPHGLSGGMKQRVGLARAYVAEPEIIFLDEPFSELDFFTAQKLHAMLLEISREKKTTIVMVSHYIDEAVALAERAVVFSDRPMVIKGVIENNLPHPRAPRSPEFFAMEDSVIALFGDN